VIFCFLNQFVLAEDEQFENGSQHPRIGIGILILKQASSRVPSAQNTLVGLIYNGS
jgi:hypothetical protein